MTYRQFRAWCAWLEIDMSRPSRTDHYIMRLTQYMESVLHMFDKKWTSPPLQAYIIPFGTSGPVKAPEKKPGKIPAPDDEYWPHPLTKEEVEAGRKSMALGHAKARMKGMKR